MANTAQQQADFYSGKYERILKNQLKENNAGEKNRTEVKELKVRLLDHTLKSDSLTVENARLLSQVEFLQKQIQQ